MHFMQYGMYDFCVFDLNVKSGLVPSSERVDCLKGVLDYYYAL